MKVAYCAGHGGNNSTPGKRTPDGEYEWNFNNKVALAFEEAMKQYKNVELLRTDDRTGKTDVPLKTRTDKANAWKADVYISFHHNANTSVWGTWTGVETFYHAGSASGKKLADYIHPKLVQAYGLRDRGIKTNSLHITSKTNMPAALVEGGFMDSTSDIKKLRDDSVLRNAGYFIAEGIAAYAGLKKKVQVVEKVEVQNGWKLESDIWKFYKNGQLVKNDWALDSKKLWYWLDSNGNMLRNDWVKWKDKYYYMQDDGSMMTNNWIRWKDKYYYVNDKGEMLCNGEFVINGKKYNLREDGSMVLTDKSGAIVE